MMLPTLLVKCRVRVIARVTNPHPGLTITLQLVSNQRLYQLVIIVVEELQGWSERDVFVNI